MHSYFNPIPQKPSQNTAGVLYVVATPIGNLGDMTLRAIECLKYVDIIACEDTRISAHLLKHFAIKNTLHAYHDHNADNQTVYLLAQLFNGKNIALISDAGTPLISDPGFRLVQACHDAGITVSPIAGASACIAGLSVAGLPSNTFYFYGFLPAKSCARQKALSALKDLDTTLIFYETPHRILPCLQDILAVFGDRPIGFCRELTKLFETVRKSTLSNLITLIHTDSQQQKGEMVLIVAGSGVDNKTNKENLAANELLTKLLAELPLKKAVTLASDISGVNKNQLYKQALQLQTLAEVNK